jgi:hypothetical protein
MVHPACAFRSLTVGRNDAQRTFESCRTVGARTGKSVSLTDAGSLFLKEGSMPLSYAETRNIVFLKSAVLGRSLLIEKK